MPKEYTFASVEAFKRASSYCSRNRGKLKSCKTVKDFENFFAQMDGFVGFAAGSKYAESIEAVARGDEKISKSVYELLTEYELRELFELWLSCFPEEVQGVIKDGFSEPDDSLEALEKHREILEMGFQREAIGFPFHAAMIRKIRSSTVNIGNFGKFARLYVDYFKNDLLRNPMDLFKTVFDEEATDYLQSVGYDLYEVEVGLFNMNEDPGTPFDSFTTLVVADCEGQAKDMVRRYDFEVSLRSGESLSLMECDCIDMGSQFYKEVWGSKEDFENI